MGNLWPFHETHEKASKAMKKKKIVVLTGAGVSAESGFSTFRDKGGLWEKYPVEKVATPEGWRADADFVNAFYNGLRRQLVEAEPNAAHRLLATLEKDYDVVVVTQNVDNLHERGGSSHVIHLHGELMKVCSSADPENPRYVRTLPLDHLEVLPTDKAGDGSKLRPFIVWFGEAVPEIERAAAACMEADILIIIGTSLQVYPAAGLIRYCRKDIPVYLIDPKEVATPRDYDVTVIKDIASKGMERLLPILPRP